MENIGLYKMNSLNKSVRHGMDGYIDRSNVETKL